MSGQKEMDMRKRLTGLVWLCAVAALTICSMTVMAGCGKSGTDSSAAQPTANSNTSQSGGLSAGPERSDKESGQTGSKPGTNPQGE